MSGPRFADLLVKTYAKGVDQRKVAKAARAHIRTLGSGVSVIGELMFYATQDDRNAIDADMGTQLGWFLRNLGEQIDELVDLCADAVDEIAPEASAQ